MDPATYDKGRSMLNIAMIAILNRPQELRMQVAVYAGMPAAVDGFRIAREVLAEVDEA